MKIVTMKPPVNLHYITLHDVFVARNGVCGGVETVIEFTN